LRSSAAAPRTDAAILLFEAVRREAEPRALQPSGEIAIERRRPLVQFPESLRREFLGVPRIADDLIDQPREAAAMGREQDIEALLRRPGSWLPHHS
jgi:hypothetical protein